VHSVAATLLADPDLSRACCIILDHRMPRLDGFALLSDVRACNPGLPAIMLTGHATPRIQACAAAAGVCSLLEKPLMDDILMDNIRSILNAGPSVST
jgi:FixJ family two-component response regulator